LRINIQTQFPNQQYTAWQEYGTRELEMRQNE
jgi:hypothetical protein